MNLFEYMNANPCLSLIYAFMICVAWTYTITMLRKTPDKNERADSYQESN